MEVTAALITGFFGLFTVWYSNRLNKSPNPRVQEIRYVPAGTIASPSQKKKRGFFKQLFFPIFLLVFSFVMIVGMENMGLREPEHGKIFTAIWALLFGYLTYTSFKNRFIIQSILLLLGLFFWGYIFTTI